jgi:sugar lactone lactonase YvrE
MGMIVWHMVPNDEPVGLGAFDLATAVQIGAKTSVFPSATNSPRGCCFGDDSGLELFVTGSEVTGFDMATPWVTNPGDVTTNGNDSATVLFEDIQFNPDGTYFAGSSDALGTITYTLSTPYLLSTWASFTGDLGGDGHFEISRDGLSFYTCTDAGLVKKQTLTGYWDVSSPTDTGLDFASGLTSVEGFALSADESRFYILETNTDTLHEFIMATPGNPSTAVPGATLAVGLAVVGTAPSGVRFSNDQSKMIICAANSVPNGGGCVATFEGDVVYL